MKPLEDNTCFCLEHILNANVPDLPGAANAFLRSNASQIRQERRRSAKLPWEAPGQRPPGSTDARAVSGRCAGGAPPSETVRRAQSGTPGRSALRFRPLPLAHRTGSSFTSHFWPSWHPYIFCLVTYLNYFRHGYLLFLPAQPAS